jgi:pyruvate dehydrogenase (quinone)
VGDCATVLDLLLKFTRQNDDAGFLEKSQRRMRSWRDLMNERGTRPEMPMKPQVVTYELNKLLRDDAIVISDSGTIATWSARYIDIRGDMQFSLSGMLATMANGLPYGIGASVAYPGRQVVCIVGDGGLTMLMGEIATLVKYKLPVKVIVIRNNELGQIKWEQLVMDANPEFGIQLQPIDFALHAQACGAAGFTIEDPKDCAGTLRRALEHPGPAVIDAVVDPNEPPLPGNISLEQSVHFVEALLKGQPRRDEIVKTIVENKVREVI